MLRCVTHAQGVCLGRSEINTSILLTLMSEMSPLPQKLTMPSFHTFAFFLSHKASTSGYCLQELKCNLKDVYL